MSVDYNSKRKEIGVKPDEVLVLSVGELIPRKNHRVIIKAIAALNNPKIRYVICGIGNELQYLKKIARDYKVSNKINFVGLRYDISEILKVSDIFVHPSKGEGLGVACLEAMSSGLPIITSNIQGIKDYSIDNVTGFSLNPNDVNGFSLAIKKLVNDPILRKEIGKRNIDRVKKWSLENSTSQIKNIIKRIIY